MNNLIAKKDGKDISFKEVIYKGISLHDFLKGCEKEGFEFFIQRPPTDIEVFEMMEQATIKNESDNLKIQK